MTLKNTKTETKPNVKFGRIHFDAFEKKNQQLTMDTDEASEIIQIEERVIELCVGNEVKRLRKLLKAIG